MKQGTKSPYTEKIDRDCRVKLTETQHDYIRAKAVLDNKDIQDVVRGLIDKAYDKEKRNGIDVIAVAKENWLI